MPSDTELHIEALSGLHLVGPLGHGPVPIIGMKLLEPAVSQLALFGYSGVLHPLLAQVVARPVDSACPEELGQRLEQLPETGLAIPDGLFILLALGDVEACADHAHGLAIGVGEDLAPGVDGAPAAVTELRAVVGLVGTLVLQCVGDVSSYAVPVAGVEPFDELREPCDLRRLGLEQAIELAMEETLERP